MRTPATVGRFVRVACSAVGLVQLGVLGLVFVVTLVGPMVYGKSVRFDLFPTWLLAADVLLSVSLVSWAFVEYRRGGFDTYETRWRLRR